jgi:manganese transport protein
MISVGYMDPGNWATDIAGGSAFGYSLLWVLVMSNFIAILLQSHSARLGIVTGKDLAQSGRDYYPLPVNFFLYVLAEIAIIACDLAEVLGMAIGIHLLFPSISILEGVLITVLDTFLLLFLMNRGIRKLEAFIISLVGIIAISFLIQIFLAKPAVTEISKGLIPGFINSYALYIAIGIIGATVMPHNLYLHSSLVQTRSFRRNSLDIRKAIRFNVIDSSIALNLALFVNAAILILSSAVFFKNGFYQVTEIQEAHQLLEPLLGSYLAPKLFAIALIAAGQSSTITGTLAGQIVMEGYLNIRIRPWIRRLITRLIAIVPALITIWLFGESSTGGLLILSQVVLSLQLGFAVVPLIHFVSDIRTMGSFVIPLWQQILSWIAVSIIVSLNIKFVVGFLADLVTNSPNPLLISFTVVPICIFCFIMLLYITIVPFFKRQYQASSKKRIHKELPELKIHSDTHYKQIAIAIDYTASDTKAINKALSIGGKEATYYLIHIVESTGAIVYGDQFFDKEREDDMKQLNQYINTLQMNGYNAKPILGFGNPKTAIPEIVEQNACDLLIMGQHGHSFLKDLILGTTIESVRHHIKIPLLIV